ncbi:ribosomal protein S18 acetylase RimI-like enzyme [Arthrobacter stackebrandtii]|uniref:Ribosomal protein S18 acetylase RimI-like enzyme n=1 Tax=Arthrobacter stackebrandtii TaxID=272161 RepID=A0ABS4YX51_9MICC|nr:GNAT family N-acetyltransferase [Arthrobacter stackebrandtii]MBP2413299.1 ribosomal protein S18 acetylase RimI-like enzyme [Arthrobacter stackebrandtii]PYG99626.1 GNAT family N-acetyltransferase [Arthrobacter stackebrandtii]
MEIVIRDAQPGDSAALAVLAAATFPLACPPGSAEADIDAFIAEHLNERAFAGYLSDPARKLFVAEASVTSGMDRLLAYSMLVDATPSDMAVAAALAAMPAGANAIELSKCYALPDVHGQGVSARLMQHTLNWISRQGGRTAWLGVNSENLRAQAFYGKHGFSVAGTKTFQLGNRVEHDYVMVRPAKN